MGKPLEDAVNGFIGELPENDVDETIPQTYTQTNDQSGNKAKPKDHSKSSGKTKDKVITETITISNALTIDEIRQLAKSKTKKQTLEEVYKRSTFWVAPGTTKKINTLAKATGLQKYMILEKAVELFYNQIFEE